MKKIVVSLALKQELCRHQLLGVKLFCFLYLKKMVTALGNSKIWLFYAVNCK